jgi:hypothetical protein
LQLLERAHLSRAFPTYLYRIVEMPTANPGENHKIMKHIFCWGGEGAESEDELDWEGNTEGEI